MEAAAKEIVSPEGYDSFWACNRGPAAQRGLNGVATFARKGLTTRADAAPLGEKELDDQGRCLKTDHGAFVLFNVRAAQGRRKRGCGCWGFHESRSCDAAL